MSWDFSDIKIQPHINAAEYGIEKESLRVTPEGKLAHTPHPFKESCIDRDFCENQTEIITGVHENTGALFAELEQLHSVVNRQLADMDELLWPFSNPPIVLSQEDIPIAHFDGALKERETYRRYLAAKYGKAKMLYSGIHFNFSFAEELLRAAFEHSGDGNFRRYKDAVYVELARKLLGYTWLIVYLTAASPLMDHSFVRLSGMSVSDRYRYASVRCSQVGYWNDFLPILDFTDVDSYTDSISRYVDLGLLYGASELYYPLRLKPRGKNSLEALKKNGVNHIELRCLDVNPLSPVGLFEEDIRFIHLLMLYLMGLSDRPTDEKMQKTAINNIKTAALYDDVENCIDRGGKGVSLHKAAADALDEIGRFAARYAPAFLSDVAYQKEKLNGKRYASLVRERFQDYIPDGLKLATDYRGPSCACYLGSAPAMKP